MTGKGAPLLDRLPLGRDRPVLAYGCALLLCAFAFVVRWFAAPALAIGYPFVSFFPATILSTFLFGVGPGIMAGVLYGFIAWYCFIPPAFEVKMSGSIAFVICFYVVVVAINIIVIDWLQRANIRLGTERERSRMLAERSELLFRELQHRVSNNLQVVSGLLALQMRSIADESAKLALDEAARRLGLIGRIHRQLYDPHGSQLQLSAFLDQLVADLIDASGRAGVEYRIESDDDFDLPPEAAVPMALIIAESISNAIEHGFARRESGSILIRATRAADGGLDLEVIDDGRGLPVGFDLGRTDSLGLKLAQMLARQLGGSFSLSGTEHTTATLRLPWKLTGAGAGQAH